MLVKMVKWDHASKNCLLFLPNHSLVAQQPLHMGIAQHDDILDPDVRSGLTSQNHEVLQSGLH